jgi:diaminopimelate epimerase
MRNQLKFKKYQGCGNDFIIIDETRGSTTSDGARSKLARSLTDRRFKVGADGILFVERAAGVDGSMRLFEPAGNEADMCGNGIRCVASYLSDKLGKPELDILTRDGVKHVVKRGNEFRVDMGVVRTTRSDLRAYVKDKGKGTDSMLRFPLRTTLGKLNASIVNSGEPHIVVRVHDIDAVDVVSVGEDVNSDKRRFPNGVNVNFAEVVGPHDVKARTYERGVYDETLACGTGATAVATVALLLKWVKRGTVRIRPPGGTIKIDLDADGRAFMTGPAVCEFEGRVTLKM